MTLANGLGHGAAGTSAWRRCGRTVANALTILLRPARSRPDPWGLPTPRRLAVAAVAIVAVFLLGTIFVDAPVAEAARRLPRWVMAFFDAITDYGKSGWFLWPLGILFLVLASLPPVTPRIAQWVLAAIMVRVGFLFLAIGVPGLFVTIVKRMIGRARPFVTGAADPFAFSPFIWRADYSSLPSGHTTTVFSVLVAVWTLFPRARTAALIYALFISASRIVVCAHYPTDVLAGALVGTVGALMVRRYFALRRLGFTVGADGAVHALPGPSLRRIKAVARALLGQ